MANPATTTTTSFVGGGGARVQVGNTTTDVIAFYGASGSVQAADVTAVLTTGAATALVGFASTAQLNAVTDAVNSILTYLKNSGQMSRT